MQAGFHRADRDARNSLNFREFVALGVMQQYDDPVLVAEFSEGVIERHEPGVAIVLRGGIVASCQRVESVAGQVAFIDDLEAPSLYAAAFVDELVIHNPAQPRPRLIDVDEIVEFRERLYEELLEEFLGVGAIAGQTPGKTIQAVEMRTNDTLEDDVVIGGSHEGCECRTGTAAGKEPVRSCCTATPKKRAARDL